ncbi:MAG: hypothetical protein ACLSWI_09970 [Candidatus Gastranaerophilaceae bacterium]
MTLQVEIGQKLNNGLTQVNTYEVPNGTNNKYAPKSFAVPDDKVDEFVKEYKDKSNKNSKLIAPFMIIGSVLGAVLGWRCTTRIDLKPWGALLSFIGGGVLGCTPAAISEKITQLRTSKKYNAHRIATQQ